MTINQIRRENLLTLVGEYPRRVFCERTGLTAHYISQLITGRQSIDEKITRQIEISLNLPSGWMDLIHPDSKTEGISHNLLINEHVLLMKFRQLTPSEQTQVYAMIDTILTTKRAADVAVEDQTDISPAPLPHSSSDIQSGYQTVTAQLRTSIR